MVWTFAYVLRDLIFFVGFFAGFSVTTLADPDSREVEFKAQAGKLKTSDSIETRLDALNWIEQNAKDPYAKEVLPILEKYIKDEKKPTLRDKAVGAVAIIALNQRPRVPCPMILLEAIDDEDENVRQTAGCTSVVFRRFPPNCLDLLFRLEKKGHSDRRSDIHAILARAAPQDQHVLTVLRAATEDKNFSVRHNAQMALFEATKNIGDKIAYLLRLHLECHTTPNLPDTATEKDKQENSFRHLAHFGALYFLLTTAEEQTNELASVMIKQLEDKEPIRRRAAAFFLSQYFAGRWSGERPDLQMLLSDSKKGNEFANQKMPVSKKLTTRLRELRIKEVLRKLSKEDPDGEARKHAASALGAVDRPSNGKERE